MRKRLSFMALGCLAAASACAPLQPWVKPYEREHLADPIMAIDPDPVSSSYMDHVFEVREGAKGATGAGGGGCGCS
jgi:hypothetical protein